MNKVALFVIIIISITIPLWSLTGEYGSSSPEARILIAYESTRFKKALIENLLPLLEEKNYSILVVDHQKGGLKGLSASDFDAVFITNSGATAKVRPQVLDWLDANGTNPSNVLVHTTQRTVWTPPVEVDSVTSASLNKKKDIAGMASDFSNSIEKLVR
ncbi:MAG: hypothetical protein PQJ58_01905 [Spirochaetales bacterium]|nr:hypothetical protein [Spirochaetales bacterium]